MLALKRLSPSSLTRVYFLVMSKAISSKILAKASSVSVGAFALSVAATPARASAAAPVFVAALTVSEAAEVVASEEIRALTSTALAAS
jgi:hypothetical protein